LGKGPVLIDRVFVLAHPAADTRNMKVQQYSVFGLFRVCLEDVIYNFFECCDISTNISVWKSL